MPSPLTSVIIFIEALLLLLPATLVYLGGMFIAILGFFGANNGGVTPGFLVLAALLLLPGYGLYSLWWLVAKHRTIPFGEVPRSVWAGIIIGSLAALPSIFIYVITMLNPRTPSISNMENLTMMLYFGGGPLLVALTLLIVMRPWMKSGQR